MIGFLICSIILTDFELFSVNPYYLSHFDIYWRCRYHWVDSDYFLILTHFRGSRTFLKIISHFLTHFTPFTFQYKCIFFFFNMVSFLLFLVLTFWTIKMHMIKYESISFFQYLEDPKTQFRLFLLLRFSVRSKYQNEWIFIIFLILKCFGCFKSVDIFFFSSHFITFYLDCPNIKLRWFSYLFHLAYFELFIF